MYLKVILYAKFHRDLFFFSQHINLRGIEDSLVNINEIFKNKMV